MGDVIPVSDHCRRVAVRAVSSAVDYCTSVFVSPQTWLGVRGRSGSAWRNGLRFVHRIEELLPYVGGDPLLGPAPSGCPDPVALELAAFRTICRAVDPLDRGGCEPPAVIHRRVHGGPGSRPSESLRRISGGDLVFCHVDGSMLHPERFTRGFSDAVRRLGLPAIRLHDLRHGWATLALQAGIHPKVVQERLGHANTGITLDTYSHVVAGLHEDAAEQVAALFRTPVSNPLAEST